MCIIRPTQVEDIPAIREIYNYYVAETTCTPEIIPPTLDEMIQRHGDILRMNMPHFVAVENNSIVGYAYCVGFGARSAHRFSAKLSIYVEKNMCGKGYGRQLLDAVLREAEFVSFRRMFALIVDSSNTKSIRLHQSAGFIQTGTYKSSGWKFNQWLDMMLMERSIGEGDTTPPE